jgi:hypothetical protein
MKYYNNHKVRWFKRRNTDERYTFALDTHHLIYSELYFFFFISSTLIFNLIYSNFLLLINNSKHTSHRAF